MNDKDWLVLKTVAEKKNITIAADYLYMTQPALTYRIKSIEKEFNTTLFIRTPKGLILTAQGDYLLQYAKKMLAEHKKAKAHIYGMNKELQGKLSLGIAASFANYKLSPILKNFLNLYPHVEISVSSGVSSEINQLLQHDEISVAILRGEYAWPEGRHLLSEEPICLTANTFIPQEALPNLPYIHYETDSCFQKEVAGWWNEHFSILPNVAMNINSTETCRQLISLGLGWSILPASSLEGKAEQGLFTKELFHADKTPLLRRTWVMYRHISLKIPAVQAFVDYLIR